ncbi:Pre-rRNA-processing protein RIX1 N-terminal domain-containing protein [Entamoeba marina]
MSRDTLSGLVHDLSQPNIGGSYDITEKEEEVAKTLLMFLETEETRNKTFHYLHANETTSRIITPILQTITTNTWVTNDTDFIKNILKIILSFFKCIPRITVASGNFTLQNKVLLRPEIFPILNIIISTEINKTTFNPRHSEIIFELLEYLVLHSTPSILYSLIQNKIMDVTSIILSSHPSLPSTLTENVLSFLISCSCLCFDSFDMQQKTSGSKLEDLFLADQQKKKGFHSQLTKRSTRFQLNSNRNGKQIELQTKTTLVSCGDRTCTATTTNVLHDSTQQENAKQLISIIQKNGEKIVDILLKSTRNDLKDKCFVVVGAIARTDNALKFENFYSSQFLFDVINSIYFWYGINDFKTKDYLVVRTSLWCLIEILKRIRSSITSKKLQIDDTGVYNMYQFIIQDFVPGKTPNDILTKSLTGLGICFELCKEFNIMVDNEDSVTKFLRSLCVEKCCITISYLYGCMMADSFKETYNLGVLTKILGFMFEENKNEKKKTKKDGDYLQEDYYSRMNEVVNETKSSIVVEEQNKDSESYLQPVRRRKLIEVVDEEVNDLDDIFGVGGDEEEEFFKEEEKEKKANKENTTTPDVNDEYQPKRSV